MPFTLVYRSPYDNLTGRYVRRFPDHSILSWFQEHWHTKSESVELLGKDVYGFESLFEQIAENEIPVPQDAEALGAILTEHIYAELETKVAPHLVEVRTDDDELDLYYYFIEDEFARQYPERVSFLMHEGSLPKNVARSESSAEPCTWLYAHSPVQSADSQTWDRIVCPGVRLADGTANVIEVYESYEKSKYVEADDFLQALVQWKNDDLDWPTILQAWAEKGSEQSESNNESKLIVADHICQLHHHGETWDAPLGDRKLFYQTIVFDDVWAAENPDLAKSIDFYASAQSLLCD